MLTRLIQIRNRNGHDILVPWPGCVLSCMVLLLWYKKQKLCFLQNGMTLVIQKTKICSVPHSITILVWEKPILLKKTSSEQVKRYRRYLHPLYHLKENQGNSISLFQSVSVSKHYIYVCIPNNREFSSCITIESTDTW